MRGATFLVSPHYLFCPSAASQRRDLNGRVSMQTDERLHTYLGRRCDLAAAPDGCMLMHSPRTQQRGVQRLCGPHYVAGYRCMHTSGVFLARTMVQMFADRGLRFLLVKLRNALQLSELTKSWREHHVLINVWLKRHIQPLVCERYSSS